MKCILVAACLVGLTAQVRAEFWDGNTLFNYLSSSQSGERLAGSGYVIGVADALYGVMHCAPANVTAGQIRDMVRNYLENVPAERHQTADSLVSKVLKATWPCQNNRGNSNGGRAL